MARKISTHQAKTHLSKVIEEVLAGAEVVVCRGSVPVVKIVQYQPSKKTKHLRRVGGKTSAPVKYEADAFAPLTSKEDLKLWGLD